MAGRQRPEGDSFRGRAPGAWIRSGLAIAVAAVFADAQSVSAAEWKNSVSLNLSTTASDNVLLGTRGNQQSDVIMITQPSLTLSRDRGRLRLRGTYSPSMIGYLQGSRSDVLQNNLMANATFEAIDRFFFVDARAVMTRMFISPLGPQSADSSIGTFNATETRTLGISPYITGRWGSGGTYTLRDDYTYTSFGSGGLTDTTTNRVTARISDAPGTFVVLSGDYSYTSTDFGGARPFVSNLGRGRATVNIDPEFNVFATAGYEDNDYGAARYSGSTYGGGFEWKPTPRTSVNGSAERRFLGTSYSFNASHRTAHTSWRFLAQRSEQTFQTPSVGTQSINTRSLIDGTLLNRFPDETARAQEVERLMRTLGLPDVVGSPTAVLAPRIVQVESIEPSVGLHGIRDTLLFNMYWRETTPISTNLTGGIQDPFNTSSMIKQAGAGLTLSHQFTAMTTGVIGADRFRVSTRSSVAGAPDFETRQQSYRLSVNHMLAARTSISATVRMLNIDSTQVGDIRERAVLFSLNHLFQ